MGPKGFLGSDIPPLPPGGLRFYVKVVDVAHVLFRIILGLSRRHGPPEFDQVVGQGRGHIRGQVLEDRGQVLAVVHSVGELLHGLIVRISIRIVGEAVTSENLGCRLPGKGLSVDSGSRNVDSGNPWEMVLHGVLNLISGEFSGGNTNRKVRYTMSLIASIIIICLLAVLIDEIKTLNSSVKELVSQNRRAPANTDTP